jgi:hypothetical protein
MAPVNSRNLEEPLAAGHKPVGDDLLMGVWSKRLLESPRGPADTRILFWPDRTGRYETWYHGLTECVTFRWSMVAAGWVTMVGIDYRFRDNRDIRREPCDWHFPDCRYELVCHQRPLDGQLRGLDLHLGGGRCDRYALLTRDLDAYRVPLWEDPHG